jgi:hypothetical protein
MEIVETSIVNALTVEAADNVLAKAEHIYDPNYGANSSTLKDDDRYQDAINQEVWESPKAVEIADVKEVAQGIGYVSYSSQVLSKTQKKQARTNIGASPDTFYNVNDDLYVAGSYTNRATARVSVPEGKRRVGMVITYKTLIDGISRWVEEQYIGTSTDTQDWTDPGNWIDYRDNLAGSFADCWRPSTLYNINDLVIVCNQLYKCKITHTSASTWNSTEAGKWVEHSIDHDISKIDILDASILHMKNIITELVNRIESLENK